MQGKCCLLIDDDPEDQELFIDALHSISASTGCYAVSNGEEALSVIENEGLVPDFIITDLHMPLMDGFTFLTRIKALENYRSIPVIVFSSECSSEYIRKATELGAIAMYPKGNLEQLVKTLKQHFFQPESITIL